MTQRETKIDECECCHYETDVSLYRLYLAPTDAERSEIWYCRVCVESGLSFLARNVMMNGPVSELARSIGYVANMILAEVQGRHE